MAKRFRQKGVNLFLKPPELFDSALAFSGDLLTDGLRRPFAIDESGPTIIRAVQLR